MFLKCITFILILYIAHFIVKISNSIELDFCKIYDYLKKKKSIFKNQ